MKTANDFQAYLKALVETPVSIIFVLLDIAGTIAVIRLVVDDWEDLLVVTAFLLVVHGGHYLIFQKQRAVAAELANRIAELEDRQPRLDLFLLDGEQSSRHLTITVPNLPQQPDLDELVRHEAEELEPDLQEDQTLPAVKAISDAMRAALMQRPKSAEEYKKECDDYLERYRKYWQDLYNYELIAARLRSLQFNVRNGGRVPAEDVVILIHFPDQLRFGSKEELMELKIYYRKRPEPPARPKPFVSLLDSFAGIGRSYLPGLLTPSPIDIPDVGPSNIRGPFIRHEDSTEVCYEITKLMHGFGLNVDPVEFFVSEDAIGHVWELEFSIHAGNLPNSITGTLLLEIQQLEAA